jgi:hypothetical protein
MGDHQSGSGSGLGELTMESVRAMIATAVADKTQELVSKQDDMFALNATQTEANASMSALLASTESTVQSLRSELEVQQSFAGQSIVDPVAIHRKATFMQLVTPISGAVTAVASAEASLKAEPVGVMQPWKR